MRVFFYWTGAWFPRYRFYRESLHIKGRFYCKQLRWLFVCVMWRLNH